jgi:hypothetical protein
LQLVFFKIYFGIAGGKMSTEILFLIGTGFLALLTIFLGISNWVLLSSLSSKISTLEDEIEKKTLELENLKKERNAAGANSFVNDQGQEKTGQPGYADTSTQQIEIVRNVRGGGFENYDADAATAPQPALQPVPQHPDQAGSVTQSDILDVVDESPGTSRTKTVRLSLFSNAKKDTDFPAAWKRLAEILPGCPNPDVVIDFINVMFLYDRELQYLEKFREVVQQGGGTLTFVNCEAELVAILQKNPRLVTCVTG